MKVWNRWDWYGVVTHTHESPRYKALGMLEPVGRTTWINRTFDVNLVLELYRMFVSTARKGRSFEDDLVLVDSFDMNTVMVDNARDRKFGPKRASYRPDAERVRYHGRSSSCTTCVRL